MSFAAQRSGCACARAAPFVRTSACPVGSSRTPQRGTSDARGCTGSAVHEMHIGNKVGQNDKIFCLSPQWTGVSIFHFSYFSPFRDLAFRHAGSQFFGQAILVFSDVPSNTSRGRGKIPRFPTSSKRRREKKHVYYRDFSLQRRIKLSKHCEV